MDYASHSVRSVEDFTLDLIIKDSFPSCFKLDVGDVLTLCRLPSFTPSSRLSVHSKYKSTYRLPNCLATAGTNLRVADCVMEFDLTTVLFEVVRSVLRCFVFFFYWCAEILESVYFFSEAHRLSLVDAVVWYVVLSAASFWLIRRYFSTSSPIGNNSILDHHVEPLENAISHDDGTEIALFAIPHHSAVNSVIEVPPPPIANTQIDAPQNSAANAQMAESNSLVPQPNSQNDDSEADAACKTCGSHDGHIPECKSCPCSKGCVERVLLGGASNGFPIEQRRCPHCHYTPLSGSFPSMQAARRHSTTKKCREAQGAPFRKSVDLATQYELKNAATKRSACGTRWVCDLCKATFSFNNRWVHIRFLCPRRRSKPDEGEVEYTI